MSGGHYDYSYINFINAADMIEATTPLRSAFVKHLRLVADAMHDIEWVDSGDKSDGDEDEAIRKCLKLSS